MSVVCVGAIVVGGCGPTTLGTSKPSSSSSAPVQKSAIEHAEYYSNQYKLSKNNILEYLVAGADRDMAVPVEYSGKFKRAEAQAAVDSLQVNFKENALARAKYYSGEKHLSKDGLKTTLTLGFRYGEGFTEEEAQYAIDNLNADYNTNALMSAQKIIDGEAMSREQLYRKLISEGTDFTEDEARYAVDNVVVDFKESALKRAEYYSKEKNMSKASIELNLTSAEGDGFTEEEAQYALEHINVNYSTNALNRAKYFATQEYKSKAVIYNQLIDENTERFTKSEAQYAVDNVKVDFKENALKRARHHADQENRSKAYITNVLTMPTRRTGRRLT